MAQIYFLFAIRELLYLIDFLVCPDKDHGGSTPYSHLKYLWLLAQKSVRLEHSDVTLAWTPAMDKFEYVCPGITRVTIIFQLLRKMVHLCEESLVRTFEVLLPLSFPLSRLNALPWDQLQESEAQDESFINSKVAWNNWLQQSVSELTAAYKDPKEKQHRIFANEQPSINAFNTLMLVDEQFQTALVGDIMGNSGVSPQVVLLGHYQYRITPESKHNLNLTLDAMILQGEAYLY